MYSKISPFLTLLVKSAIYYLCLHLVFTVSFVYNILHVLFVKKCLSYFYRALKRKIWVGDNKMSVEMTSVLFLNVWIPLKTCN